MTYHLLRTISSLFNKEKNVIGKESTHHTKFTHSRLSSHQHRLISSQIFSNIVNDTPPQPFYGPFSRDHPGEPVPEENFWTLWCKGRLTEADTPTIRLGATPSGLTSAHLYHPLHIFTGRMPFLPPNQQRQSTEGKLLRYKALKATIL